MALPPGFTLDQILNLPEVAEVVEKARNGNHEVCGLWLNKEKGYMAGSAGKQRYWVFKNDRKEEGSQQPDYRLCVSRQLPREDHPRAAPGARPTSPGVVGGPRQTTFQGRGHRPAPPAQRSKPAPYNLDERGEPAGSDYAAF